MHLGVSTLIWGATNNEEGEINLVPHVTPSCENTFWFFPPLQRLSSTDAMSDSVTCDILHILSTIRLDLH